MSRQLLTYLQGWRLNNCSGQPVPVLCHPHWSDLHPKYKRTAPCKNGTIHCSIMKYKCLGKTRKAKPENSCWQSSKSSQEYAAHSTSYLFVYSYLLLGILFSTKKFQSLFILCKINMKIILYIPTQYHHIL